MEKFAQVTGPAAWLSSANIDTDQILPARFLGVMERPDFGNALFRDQRFDADDTEQSEFVLNRLPSRNSTLLVARQNFGCGSSREQAVYALADYGIRTVIAPSFGDIFYANAFNNGLLLITLPASEVEALGSTIEHATCTESTVDLVAQTITGPDGTIQSFEIDPFLRSCLLEGLDELEYTLRLVDQVAVAERRLETEWPWNTGLVSVIDAVAAAATS